MPVSVARAKQCSERLRDHAQAGGVIDMSDFCLHEAQAQLQLGLLGLPESFMDSTNRALRHGFSMDPSSEPGKLSQAMADVMNSIRETKGFCLPSEVAESACPVKGPLSRALQTSEFDAMTDYGNALLILFAGHDTTGHALTWCLFELARHPEHQKLLQQEVDDFFGKLDDREPTYTELSQLPFMDRCDVATENV